VGQVVVAGSTTGGLSKTGINEKEVKREIRGPSYGKRPFLTSLTGKKVNDSRVASI